MSEDFGKPANWSGAPLELVLGPRGENRGRTDGGPEAVGSIDQDALVTKGHIVLMFDCGITGARGSWSYVCDFARFTDELIDGLEEDGGADALDWVECYARLLEAEASRARALSKLIFAGRKAWVPAE
jgi:hypothetical protein